MKGNRSFDSSKTAYPEKQPQVLENRDPLLCPAVDPLTTTAVKRLKIGSTHLQVPA